MKSGRLREEVDDVECKNKSSCDGVHSYDKIHPKTLRWRSKPIEDPSGNIEKNIEDIVKIDEVRQAKRRS